MVVDSVGVGLGVADSEGVVLMDGVAALLADGVGAAPRSPFSERTTMTMSTATATASAAAAAVITHSHRRLVRTDSPGLLEGIGSVTGFTPQPT